MKARTFQGLVAAVAAFSGPDSAASVVASLEGGSSGGVGAAEHLGVEALVATRNAGVPVYEVGQIVIVSATRMGTIYATEYRRAYEVGALDSPTKFVAVGAAAPDNFYVVRTVALFHHDCGFLS